LIRISRGYKIRCLLETAFIQANEATVLDLSKYGPIVHVHWNKLNGINFDKPAKPQLHEFYDGLYFAEFKTKHRCDVAWFPDQGHQGTFLISILPPFKESEEWEPLEETKVETLRELREHLPFI
jgi:hypothetical protein